MTSAPTSSVAPTSVTRARKMREMTVELAPITDEDVAAVADFLHANHNDRVPWLIMLGGAMDGGGTQSRIHAPGRAACRRHTTGSLLRAADGRAGGAVLQHGIVVRAAQLSSGASCWSRRCWRRKGYHCQQSCRPTRGRRRSWPGSGSVCWNHVCGARFQPAVAYPAGPNEDQCQTNVIERTLADSELELYHGPRTSARSASLVLIRGRSLLCHVPSRRASFSMTFVWH